MIPGLRETLRVAGTASITTDQAQLKFAQVGKNPVKTGLLINVTKVYFHCGKAMIRSKLWDEGSKVAKGEFPTFGAILKEQAKLADSKEQMEEMIEEVYTEKLY